MDTTAKTFVGGDDNEELVGGWLVGRNVFEDLCRIIIRMFARSDAGQMGPQMVILGLTLVGDTIALSCLHGALGLCKLGGGNHFHRLKDLSAFGLLTVRGASYLCDFFDVPDGLETKLDLAKGGHVPGPCRDNQRGGDRLGSGAEG